MEELDEFGIPIKKQTSKAIVDEFGIPIKKKDDSQSDSQPISPEKVWGQKSQPKSVYDTLVTDQPKPAVASAISAGKPKIVSYDQYRVDKVKNDLSAIRQKTEQDKIDAKQEVISDFADTGFINKAATFGKNIWNTIVDVNAQGISAVIPGIEQMEQAPEAFRFDIDRSKKFVDKAKREHQDLVKEAIKQKTVNKNIQIPSYDPAKIKERAFELAVKEKVGDKVQARVNDYMENLPDRYGNDLKQLVENKYGSEYKQSTKEAKNALDISVMSQKEADDSQSKVNNYANIFAQYKANGQIVPKEIQARFLIDSKYNEDIHKQAIKDKDNHSNIVAKNNNLAENIDTFNRDYGFLSNTLKNLTSASLHIGSGILGGTDYFASLEKNIANRIGIHKFDFAFDTASKIAKYSSEKLKKGAEYIESVSEKSAGVEDVNSIGGFGRFAINEVIAKNAPMLGLIATGPIGVGAVVQSSIGETFEGMKEQQEMGEKQYSDLQLYGIPAAKGAVDLALFTFDGQMLKNFQRVIKDVTASQKEIMAKAALEQLLKKPATYKEVGKQILGKQMHGLAVMNGVTISKNIIDIVGGVDPDRSITEGTFDASAASLILVGAMHSVPIISAKIGYEITSDTKGMKLSSQILSLEKLMDNETLSQATRDALKDQHKKATDKLGVVLKKQVRDIQSLSNDQYKEIVGINKKIVELKNKAQDVKIDEKLSDDMKTQILDGYAEDFIAANKRKGELVSNGAKAQFERLSTEEQDKYYKAAEDKLNKELNPDGTTNEKASVYDIVKEAIATKNLEDFEKSKDPLETVDSEPTPTELTVNEKELEVEKLREKERLEKEKVDPNDKERLDEIYDKYDKLISPLLREIEGAKAEVSPIELKEGEELIDTAKDKKGRTYTYTGVTSEKDGVKTTKFKFNRSDKSSEQRNDTGVDTDKVLDKYGYEIPEGEIPEGAEIIKIHEVREGTFRGEESIAATVTFKDPETGGTFKGEVNLKRKAKQTPTEKTQGTPDVISEPIDLEVPKPKVEDVTNKTDVELEDRYQELDEKGFKEFTDKERDEFNAIEKEQQKREWKSIVNAPINKVKDILIDLKNKLKEGKGVFVEKWEVNAATKAVDRYSNPSKLTDKEILKDFSDALKEDPTKRVDSAILFRESFNEASKRGLTMEDLLKEPIERFTRDGYSEETARNIVSKYLEPVLKGAKEEVPKPKVEAPKEVETEVEGETLLEKSTKSVSSIKDGESFDLPDGSKIERTGDTFKWNRGEYGTKEISREDAIRITNNKIAESNAGSNIEIRNYNTETVKGEELKVGDVYVRDVNGTRYVYRLLEKPTVRSGPGAFFGAKVEILSIGKQPIEILTPEPGSKIGKVFEGEQREGGTVTDYFKSPSKTQRSFGKVKKINNWEEVSKPKVEAPKEVETGKKIKGGDKPSTTLLNGKELTYQESFDLANSELKEIEAKERTLSVQKEYEQKIKEINRIKELAAKEEAKPIEEKPFEGEDKFTIDGKEYTQEEAIIRSRSVPFGSKMEYTGTNKQAIEFVNDYNKSANPYSNDGKLKGSYIQQEFIKAIDNMSFKKFGNLYRKHVDPYFSRANRVVRKGSTFEELSRYIIGDALPTSFEESNFRAFAEAAGIKVPEFVPKEKAKVAEVVEPKKEQLRKSVDDATKALQDAYNAFKTLGFALDPTEKAKQDLKNQAVLNKAIIDYGVAKFKEKAFTVKEFVQDLKNNGIDIADKIAKDLYKRIEKAHLAFANLEQGTNSEKVKEKAQREIENAYNLGFKEAEAQAKDALSAQKEVLGIEKAEALSKQGKKFKEQKESIKQSIKDKIEKSKDAIKNINQIVAESLPLNKLNKVQVKSILNNAMKIFTYKDLNNGIENFVNHVDKVINDVEYQRQIQVKADLINEIKESISPKSLLKKSDANVKKTKITLKAKESLKTFLDGYSNIDFENLDIPELETIKEQIGDIVKNGKTERQHIENQDRIVKDQIERQIPSFLSEKYENRVEGRFDLAEQLSKGNYMIVDGKIYKPSDLEFVQNNMPGKQTGELIEVPVNKAEANNDFIKKGGFLKNLREGKINKALFGGITGLIKRQNVGHSGIRATFQDLATDLKSMEFLNKHFVTPLELFKNKQIVTYREFTEPFETLLRKSFGKSEKLHTSLFNIWESELKKKGSTIMNKKNEGTYEGKFLTQTDLKIELKREGKENYNIFENKSNSDVVQLYSELKDPMNVRKFLSDGHTIEDIKKIIDFVHNDPKLNDVANGNKSRGIQSLSDLYKNILPKVNETLDLNGHDTIGSKKYLSIEDHRLNEYNKARKAGNNKAEAEKIADEKTAVYAEVLKAFYGENVPEEVPYVPSAVEPTQEVDLDVLKQFEDFHNGNSTLLFGNLYGRKEGGSLVLRPFQDVFREYAQNSSRFIEGASSMKNVSNLFLGKANEKLLIKNLGSDWVNLAKNKSIGILTGKSEFDVMKKSDFGNKIGQWTTLKTGVQLVLTPVTMIGQVLGTPNFYMSLENLADRQRYRKIYTDSNLRGKYYKAILNSSLMDERINKSGHDVDSDMLRKMSNGKSAGVRELSSSLVSDGLILTAISDAAAILYGGIGLYGVEYERNFSEYKKTMSPKDADLKAERDAMIKLFAVAEKTQASSQEAFTGRYLKDPLAKALGLYSFQGPSIQMGSLAMEAYRDVKAGRVDKIDGLKKIAYFGMVGAIMFNAAKKLLPKDDDKVDATGGEFELANETFSDILNQFGILGKQVAILKDEILKSSFPKALGVPYDNSKEKVTDKILRVLGQESPAFGATVRTVKKVLDSDEQYSVYRQISAGIESVGLFPADKVNSIATRVTELFDTDFKWGDRVKILTGVMNETSMLKYKDKVEDIQKMSATPEIKGMNYKERIAYSKLKGQEAIDFKNSIEQENQLNFIERQMGILKENGIGYESEISRIKAEISRTKNSIVEDYIKPALELNESGDIEKAKKINEKFIDMMIDMEKNNPEMYANIENNIQTMIDNEANKKSSFVNDIKKAPIGRARAMAIYSRFGDLLDPKDDMLVSVNVLANAKLLDDVTVSAYKKLVSEQKLKERNK